MRRFLPVVLPLCLTGCFPLAHPFSNPGSQAQSLTERNLPPARLAVPTPRNDLLPDAASALWAHEAAKAVLAQSVPAVAQPVKRGDWWLGLSAVRHGGAVVPHYVIMTPDGKSRAQGDGPPVDMTTWASGNPDMVRAVAAQEGPEIARMLTGIQADMMNQDPHSLMHRAAHVYFAGVTGAPGDGNVSLARAFYAALPDATDSIQTTPKGADFTVRTVVTLSSGPAGTTGHPQQRIEIAWHVLAADGKEAGAATQLHDIPAHSLDHAWGDVAEAAAEEAAGGVRTIVTNYSGRDHKALPATSEGVPPAVQP